jgi:hypothetical protein
MSDWPDYEPGTILKAWSSASAGTCLLIFTFLYPLAGIDTGRPWIQVIGTNTFLVCTAWCIGAYFIAALTAFLFRGRLSWRLPVWLFIPVLGSLIFASSWWGTAHWYDVSTYRPDSIFRSTPPPPVWEVVQTGAVASLIFIILSGSFSLIASLIPTRGEESGILGDDLSLF